MNAIPIATEQQKRDGWTFDYKLIENISELTYDGGFPVGMEGVEMVLSLLADRGYAEYGTKDDDSKADEAFEKTMKEENDED